LLIIIAQVALYGNGMFQSEINLEDSSMVSVAFYYFSLLLALTLGIWTICFAVVGISVVQKLSVGKSILNLMLPGLIMLAIVLLFILPIVLMKN